MGRQVYWWVISYLQNITVLVIHGKAGVLMGDLISAEYNSSGYTLEDRGTDGQSHICRIWQFWLYISFQYLIDGVFRFPQCQLKNCSQIFSFSEIMICDLFFCPPPHRGPNQEYPALIHLISLFSIIAPLDPLWKHLDLIWD